jgi:hypothetical protein
MRNPKHETNITAKAERAIEAIDSLINHRLIGDEDLPEIADLATGRKFMLEVLQPGNVATQETAAWWVAVGIEHDRIRGVYAYGPRERATEPTQFASSRQTVLDMLDGLVWAAENVHRLVPDDPFAGLNGEAF